MDETTITKNIDVINLIDDESLIKVPVFFDDILHIFFLRKDIDWVVQETKKEFIEKCNKETAEANKKIPKQDLRSYLPIIIHRVFLVNTLYVCHLIDHIFIVNKIKNEDYRYIKYKHLPNFYVNMMIIKDNKEYLKSIILPLSTIIKYTKVQNTIEDSYNMIRVNDDKERAKIYDFVFQLF